MADPTDLEKLREAVSHQLYGPSRLIGPFPRECRSLWDSMEQMPMSEFQEGVATALKRRFRGFAYEVKLADGVERFVRLGKRQISQLERRGVFRYLSRLLLAYVRDRDSARRRPDLQVQALEEIAAIVTELAGECAGQEPPTLSAVLQETKRSALKAARVWRRSRTPGIGRPAVMPQPSVVRRDFRKLRSWLKPRWEGIRSSSHDRGLWVLDVRATLRSIIPTKPFTDSELRKTLWPKKRRRRIDTLAVDLLALGYRVSPRAVRYGKKPR